MVVSLYVYTCVWYAVVAKRIFMSKFRFLIFVNIIIIRKLFVVVTYSDFEPPGTQVNKLLIHILRISALTY